MKKLFLSVLFLPLFSFLPFTNGEDIFFGDSITFGNELGVQQYTARWSTQYCQAVPTDELNDAYSGAAMTPGLNTGRPVFDVSQVPVYQNSDRHIFVSYWVNDYLYGGTTAAFATATTNAVNGIIAKGWPAAKIVLCFNYLPESPGTWINMTDAKARQWLAALRSVRQAKGTSFLDFYTPIYNRSDKGSYSDDGIHPTAAWNGIMKQYALTNIEAPSSALPVTFASLSGQHQGLSNILKWTVAQEQNVSHYEVTRSEDGMSWTRAGEVESLGNTALQRSYGFTDNGAGVGKQLYRLKVVDADGSVKFSNVIILNGGKAATLSLGGLFPNPAVSKLNVVVSAPEKERVRLSLIDALGRTIQSRQETVEAGANTIDLNLSLVKAGVYFVKIVSEKNSATAIERFVKD